VTLAVIVDTVSGRVLRRQRIPVFEWQRLALTGCRLDIPLLSGHGKTTTPRVSSVFSMAVMEKCWDAYGGGEYYLRSSSSATEDASAPEASSAVDRKSMGLTVAERPCKADGFLCISYI
jgi:hypothetical protein